MNPNDNREIKIRVIYEDNQPFIVTVSPVTTVHELKEKLYDLTKLPIDEQKLIFRGKVLENNNDMISCKIEDDCTIHLIHYDVC